MNSTPDTLEGKLIKLGINQQQRFIVEAMPYYEPDLLQDNEKTALVRKKINLSDLHGISRIDVSSARNWINCLNECHRMCNFNIYSTKNAFDLFLNSATIDLPVVYEIDGKFFISTDGKHRLIIAKCVGIISANVFAYTKNKKVKNRPATESKKR